MNSLFLESPVSTLNELTETIEETRNTYAKEYYNYLNTGIIQNFIKDLKIAFIELDIFVPKVKKLINNQSYFSIIINNNQELSLISTKYINGFVSSRCNKDLSIKVITDNNN